MTDWRMLVAAATCSAAMAASSAVEHLVFPVPGHPDYSQNLRWRTFELRQRTPRAFSYSYRVKVSGLPADTPESNSNVGMTVCVTYGDGTKKWTEPADRPSPVKTGWQEVSDVFQPVRAVSNVTLYVRIARPGEAWFDAVRLDEMKPAKRHDPCRMREVGGRYLLENDFVSIAVDPAAGGAAVSAVTKSNGVEHVAAGGVLFDDRFRGMKSNAGRLYRVVRMRDTPGSVELTLAVTGPEGMPFVEIEKTFRLDRHEEGVEVVRTYRNLPASMGGLKVEPEDGEPIEIPCGGEVTRRVVCLGRRSEDAGTQLRTLPPFSLELSQELESPHTPWLKPYAGGSLRVLFVLDIRQQREIVELAERMSLEPHTVRIAYVRENMAWGMIDRYGTYGFSDANDALAKELDSGRFDAVVMAGRLWERIDVGNRAKIMAALDAGTGLVMVEKGGGPLANYNEDGSGRDAILGRIPKELLPFGANRVRTFSKGGSRAVMLDYRAFDGLTPFVPFEAKEPGFFYADYTLGMIAKCILWASRREMPLPAGAEVVVSTEDSGDGLLVTRRIYRGGDGVYDFACEVSRGESSPEAKARLAVRERELAYPSERPPWPDFPFSVGECCHRNGMKRYLLPLHFGQLKKLGVNQIRFWAVDPPAQYRPYLKYGLGFDFPIASGQLRGDRFEKEFREPYLRTKDRAYLCRKPCLSDPAVLEADKAEAGRIIDMLECLKPASYDCNDENSLTRWSAAFDFCFSEHCLAAFRGWLRTQYSSLEGLNGAWGTDFASWNDIVPDTTDEARARARRTGRRAYGAWADHRTFMEKTYAGYFAAMRSVMDAKAPGLRFDMSGTQPPNGWTGMDMWLMSKVIDLPAAYDVENLGEIIRSFNRPCCHPWFGYGMTAEGGVFRLWNDAFRYLDFGLSFYHEGLILMPDFTVPPQVRALVRELRDLREGGARLLRSLEGRKRALVHYSQASVHAAQIEERYADFVAARDRAVRRLVETDTQFRFVSYEEIENGALEDAEVEILVLPHSAALSKKEALAMRRFSARGGRIVGDVHSGKMDQHCRTLPRSSLSGVVAFDDGLGAGRSDGIRMYEYVSREGLPGTYYGFTRAVAIKPAGTARRTVRLASPMNVYDMRKKRFLGCVSSFEVALGPAEAAFFAALPYRVGEIKADRAGNIVLAVSAGSSGLHPVRMDAYVADGRRIATEIISVVGGRGRWTLPHGASGVSQLVFTDFVSGASCVLTLCGSQTCWTPLAPAIIRMSSKGAMPDALRAGD